MAKINIKLMSEDAYIYLKKNIETITKKIIENDDNSWVDSTFPVNPIFVEKQIFIDDFNLIDNPDSADKDIDFENSVTLYESLKTIPNFILCDDRFWLWLYLDKFYSIVRRMMKVNGVSTIKDHWTFTQGTRRGIFFGVLSRCYFRVALTKDDTLEDKYELTRWIIENPLRFREFSWRAYSSELHIVRGCIKGEKKAIEELGCPSETWQFYNEIAKCVSNTGSVKLLDVISEQDIEEIVYNKTKELLLEQK